MCIRDRVYTAKYGERSKNLKRGDHLGPDGEQEKDTETGTKYRGEVGDRSEIHAPDDKLWYDGLSFENGTEYGNFQPHDARREKFRKQRDHLGQDGDLEKDTETGTKYKGETGERSKKNNKGDTLNPLDGNIEGDTETSDKFSAKYGRRASKSKPKTAMHLPDGKMEDRTENQEYLSNLDADHPSKYDVGNSETEKIQLFLLGLRLSLIHI